MTHKPGHDIYIGNVKQPPLPDVTRSEDYELSDDEFNKLLEQKLQKQREGPPLDNLTTESQESPAPSGDSAFTGTDPVFTGEEIDVALWGRVTRTPRAITAILTSGGSNKPAAFKIRRTDGKPFTFTKKGEKEKVTDPNDIDPVRAKELADEYDAILQSGIGAHYDLDQSIHLNYDNFSTAKDFETAHQAMAEHISRSIDEARRGVVSDEARDALARDLSDDPKFLAKFLRQGPGATLNDSEIIAAHKILEASARMLKERAMFMRRHATGDQLVPAQMAFLQSFNVHKQVLAQYMGRRAESGRALRAWQGNSLLGSDVQVRDARMKELIEQYGSGMDIDRIADQVLASDSLFGVNKTVKHHTGGISKWGAALTENMVGSILSGGSTASVNLVGNTAMVGRHVWNTAVASRLGRFTSRHHEIEVGEAMANIFGVLMGFKDASKAFLVSLRTTEPYGGSAKFEGVREKAISANALGFKKGGMLGWLADVYGHIARAPMERILGPSDAFFKVINERGMWAQLAYRQAVKEAREEGLDGDGFKARLSAILGDPSQNTLNRMVEHGEKQTFTNPLGDAGMAIQKLINKTAIGKMFVPVFRTPVQITKVGFFEDSPLGFLMPSYRRRMFPKPEPGTDTLTARQIEDAQMARSQMMTGIGIMTWFGLAAWEGNLTGTGPGTSDARKALKASRPPRSLAIEFDEYGRPTKWMSFDRMEPWSLTIGLIADFADVMKLAHHMDLDETQEEWRDSFAAAMVTALAENTLNKTYMRGVNEAIDAVTDSKRYAERWAASFVNAQIPLSGARRDWRKASDIYMREAQGILDKLKNSLPYWSKDLPKLQSINGEYIEYEHVLNLSLKEYETDPSPLDQENGRLWDSVEAVALKTISREISGVKLDSSQYHDLMQIRSKGIMVMPSISANGEFTIREHLIPLYNKGAEFESRVTPINKPGFVNFEGAIEAMMLSPAYNNPMTTDYMRVHLLSTVQKKFDNAARKFLQANDSDVGDAVMLYAQNQKRRLYGQERTDQALIDQGIEPIKPTGGTSPLKSLFQ